MSNRRRRMLAAAMVAALGMAPASHADNWPQWRGPRNDGISTEQGLPASWSKTVNVVWRTPLPGRAGATPCVWGDRIYLTSIEGDDLVLLCIAAEDGAIKWKRTVGSGNQDARAGEAIRHRRRPRPMANMCGCFSAPAFWPATRSRARRCGGSMPMSGLEKLTSSLG